MRTDKLFSSKPPGTTLVQLLAGERRDLGLFLISLCALMYEILITRILSVVMYYNFVSLVVVMVLFGISLGSCLVYLFPHSFPLSAENDEPFARNLNYFAFCLLACFLFLLGFRFLPDFFGRMIDVFKPGIVEMVKNPFEAPKPAEADRMAMALAGVFYILLTIPYIFVGTYTAQVFQVRAKEIGTSYSWDLLGAGLGCLLIIPVIDILGAPAALLVISVLALGGGMLVFRRYSPGAVVTVVCCAALILLNSIIPFSEIDFVHGRYDTEVKYTKWNSYSRIAVYPLEPTIAEREGRSGRPPDKMGLAINETGYTALLIEDDTGIHDHLKNRYHHIGL